MARVSRLGGARCSLVGSCVVRFCKAWTSWRVSARCGIASTCQVWFGIAWHGFHGWVNWGEVRRVVV